MDAQLVVLEGNHIEVVQSTAAGASERRVISDAELDMMVDRRKEVFERRGVGWKSGAAGKDAKGDGINSTRAGTTCDWRGLFEMYEAPAAEGNDALAHMLGEDLAARIIVIHACIDFCLRILLIFFFHYTPSP